MKLINGWQRNFPLTQRPFVWIGDEMRLSESEVMSALEAMAGAGLLTRIGAVVRPNTAGASTLAAMKISPDDLERVASIVSGEPGVNHNYEREHAYNLWFVATAGDRQAVRELLGRVSRSTGYEVLDLRLKKAHHIDLGFAIGSGGCLRRSVSDGRKLQSGFTVTKNDRALLAAIENGLPLVSRPFRQIGASLELNELDVISSLERLVGEGVISRFGLVVRHRKMGFTANAMAVWNIAEQDVDDVGKKFSALHFVTLCYQRERCEPHWPYNLYCMIHGREKKTVLSQVAQLNEIVGSLGRDHNVLFSKRCFKQRGARFTQSNNTGLNVGRDLSRQGEVSHV